MQLLPGASSHLVKDRELIIFRRIKGENLQNVSNLLTQLSLANVCPVCSVNDELWVGADLLKSRKQWRR